MDCGPCGCDTPKPKRQNKLKALQAEHDRALKREAVALDRARIAERLTDQLRTEINQVRTDWGKTCLEVEGAKSEAKFSRQRAELSERHNEQLRKDPDRKTIEDLTGNVASLERQIKWKIDQLGTAERGIENRDVTIKGLRKSLDETKAELDQLKKPLAAPYSSCCPYDITITKGPLLLVNGLEYVPDGSTRVAALMRLIEQLTAELAAQRKLNGQLSDHLQQIRAAVGPIPRTV